MERQPKSKTSAPSAQLVENWAVWRDALMWDRFRTVWHDDGRMMATWFQGTADEFIKVSQEGYERGVRILHFLGGTSIDIAGMRAIAQTKMTISQRAPRRRRRLRRGVHRPLLRLPGEARGIAGAWCCASRSTKRTASTRSTPPPGSSSTANLLAQFPEGYRHLAYLQTRIGYKVKTDMPGLDGPEVEALYRRGEAWLKGQKL